MRNRRTCGEGQRGYSLAEMLVVVALIGMFSLVSVPQFMTYYQQSKVRASVRQFNGHLRTARLRAITRNNPTAISFVPGLNPPGNRRGAYGIFDRSASGTTWTLVGAKVYYLEDPVYFLASDFAVNSARVDALHDVVFLANGTISNIPAGDPIVELKTNANVPNNHCTITLNAAGFFTSVMSTD